MKKITSKLRLIILSIILLVTAPPTYSTVVKDSINGSKKRSLSQIKYVDNKKNISTNTAKSEFTYDYLIKNFPLTQETQNDLELAKATCSEIDKTNSLTDELEPKKLSMLPLGIKKTIGGIQYLLGISNAKFTPEYTELTAFVRIIIPQRDEVGKSKELFFGANNIKLYDYP